MSAAAFGFHRAGNNGHWKKIGHDNKAHIHWVDDTGSAWPVRAGKNNWTAGVSAISLQYAANAGDCGHHCINVDSIDPGDAPPNYDFDNGCDGGNVAVTVIPPLAGAPNNHYDEQLRIRFNADCRFVYGPIGELTVVCHEMGHSVGLRHYSQSPGSCMRNGAFDPYPDAHDFNVVDSIYDHNG